MWTELPIQTDSNNHKEQNQEKSPLLNRNSNKNLVWHNSANRKNQSCLRWEFLFYDFWKTVEFIVEIDSPVWAVILKCLVEFSQFVLCTNRDVLSHFRNLACICRHLPGCILLWCCTKRTDYNWRFGHCWISESTSFG